MKTKQKNKKTKKLAKAGLLAAGLAGASVGGYYGYKNRKAIASKATKTYKNIRRKATGGKYRSQRHAFADLRTGEVLGTARLNTKARKNAAQELLKSSKVPDNRAVNSYLLEQRRSALGGLAKQSGSTAGRTKGELEMLKNMQKKRSQKVKEKADKLRKQGKYNYFNSLDSLNNRAEFKKSRKKLVKKLVKKNPVSNFIRKRKRYKAASKALTGLEITGGLAALGSATLAMRRGLRKSSGSGNGYVPDANNLNIRTDYQMPRNNYRYTP